MVTGQSDCPGAGLGGSRRCCRSSKGEHDRLPGTMPRDDYSDSTGASYHYYRQRHKRDDVVQTADNSLGTFRCPEIEAEEAVAQTTIVVLTASKRTEYNDEARV